MRGSKALALMPKVGRDHERIDARWIRKVPHLKICSPWLSPGLFFCYYQQNKTNLDSLHRAGQRSIEPQRLQNGVVL